MHSLQTVILQILLLVGTVFTTAALTSFYTRTIRVYALKRQLMDVPNGRSMHEQPTPRLGGVAIFLGVCTGLVLIEAALAILSAPSLLRHLPHPAILGGGLLIFAAGLYDDLRDMKPIVKLAAQAGVALVTVLAGIRIDLTPYLASPAAEVASIALSFAWIIAIMNAINLMDGLDGLAAGISTIAAASLVIAAGFLGQNFDHLIVIAFIGALLGFLRHNSHPATIFMGDCGSLFLGFMLATLSLGVASSNPTAGGSLPIIIPVLALGLPLLDTSVAIIRRAKKGDGIFSADRDHIHHRCTSRLGLTHRGSVILLYAVSLLFGATAILVAIAEQYSSFAFALALAACLVFWLLIKLGYVVPERQNNKPACNPVEQGSV